MKLAVVVDSKTGNTRQAADWIVRGMNQVEDTARSALPCGAGKVRRQPLKIRRISEIPAERIKDPEKPAL